MQDTSGILLIDKPLGITSFDIIRRLRQTTGIKKIGHAGTLDPLATGLMIMLIGQATKRADEFSKLSKTYEATMTLGATSTTGDVEGVITKVRPLFSDYRGPTFVEVEGALSQFTGEIEQTPSRYSAIKIKGQEAYKRARRGEDFAMPSRTVTIHALGSISYTYPVLSIRANVSKGTYIRTLAEDIGTALGTGAHLTVLRRTSIGNFLLGQAHKLDEVTPDSLEGALI